MVTSWPTRISKFDLDLAHVQDALDLGIKLVARNAIAGNAVPEHATQALVRLEDGAGMALAAQLIGRRQTRRAATDDGDALAGVWRRRSKP